MLDVKQFVDGLHEYIGRALSPLAQRLKALEDRPAPERGEKGSDGAHGKDGAPGQPGERGPQGEKGADGAHGKDGAPGQPGERGPQGEKGADGAHGKDGAPGQPGERGPQGEKGADGAHGKDGAPGQPGERGPQGEKGADGAHGKDGAPGQPGERGPQGEKGMDGASVTVDQVMPLLEAGVAKWMLEWERRAQDTLAKAVERVPAGKDGAPGRDGTDGKDGRDGLSLDDIAIGFEGRTLTLSLSAGDRIVTRAVKLPALPDYRGVYKRQPYEAGDMVTYGGSMWLVKQDTQDSPPGPAWQLVVKGGK